MWLGLPYWQRQVVTGQAAAQNPAERSSRAPCPFRPARPMPQRLAAAGRGAPAGPPTSSFFLGGISL